MQLREMQLEESAVKVLLGGKVVVDNWDRDPGALGDLLD